MRLLLDTATVLWLSHDADRLTTSARAAYADPGHDVFVKYRFALGDHRQEPHRQTPAARAG